MHIRPVYLSGNGLEGTMPLLGSGDLFANRFKIDRLAGSGGMGAVYRALDRISGDPIALKVLQNHGKDPNEAERFSREAQLLAELRHPGIVNYVAHGVTPDGQRFLAMEWLDGEDLAHRLARGPLPVDDSVLLIHNIAEALTVAHQCGIVHRDLKPSNLFLCNGDLGRVKLLDFGIARRLATSKGMTRTGLVIGTPEYMAPEQARGVRELTPAADIFSLGCVLYECLTGEPPFVAEHIAAVLVRILFEEPMALEQRRPGIPETVSQLLRQMLSKDPAQRIADAGALVAVLTSIGEVAEVPLLSTLAAPARVNSSFAENEQTLFSLVVASGPQDSADGGSTIHSIGDQIEKEKRSLLLAALRVLGVHADYLVSGSLVVTVPQTGSVTDQVDLAARVSLLIKERWPIADVAVATGRGVAHGVTAVGEVADRATRLLQRRAGAQPTDTLEPASGIWLDKLSTRLLGPRFAVTRTLEGGQLISAEREVDVSRPLLGKPTLCVGRDTELATLEGQLNNCIEDSEARAVLITAPPGVGKSRLRHEFLRRVEKREDSITVLLGRGDLISAGAPYAILGQAIRRFCDLSGSESIEEQRFRLRERIGRLFVSAEQERVVAFLGEMSGAPFVEEATPMLRVARKDAKVMSDRIRRAFLDWLSAECRAAPVLLVLDDLQWGDSLTLALLEESLRELQGASLFVLGLARPEVHEAFPKLLRSPRLQEIPLRGLSKKACERLIQQVLGKQVAPAAMARAVEQAAGNALFLEELIRSLAEGESIEQTEMPETVVAMLQARIGRFEVGPRRAVRAAAVFGQTFWSGGVAAILGLPKTASGVEDWLSMLVNAEVIDRRSDSRLANEPEYGFRHALIRDAAYALLTEHDLTTGHYLAGAFLEAAGEREAVVIAEHYERGGQLERAAPLYQQAGDYAAQLGLNSTARRNYVSGINILEKLPGSLKLLRLRAAAMIKQTRVSLLSDTNDQNLQRLSAAEALILTNLASTRDSPDPIDKMLLARAYHFMGRVQIYAGRYQDAIGWYQRVLTMAPELDDPELTAIPATDIGMAKVGQGHMGAARQLLTRALEALRQMGNEFELVRAQMYMGLTLVSMGEYRNGFRHLDEWDARARQMQQPLAVARGRLVRAMAHRSGMNWPGLIQDNVGVGAAMLKQGEKLYALMTWSLEAWAHVHLGQREEAADLRSKAVTLTSELGGQYYISELFAASDAETALLTGNPADAIHLARAAAQTSGLANLPLSWGIAERVWAVALSRLGGTLAEVEQRMQESLRVLGLGDLVLDAAQTELWWGRILRERGDAARAQPHFQKAIAIFESSGCDYATLQAKRFAGGLDP